MGSAGVMPTEYLPSWLGCFCVFTCVICEIGYGRSPWQQSGNGHFFTAKPDVGGDLVSRAKPSIWHAVRMGAQRRRCW